MTFSKKCAILLTYKASDGFDYQSNAHRTDMTQEKDLAVEFLDTVIKSLVDFPNDVKITKTVDEMGVLLTLDLNPEDMGKIIGRKGATAKSIRTLLRVVGMKNNARVNMKINEPEGRVRPMAADVDQTMADLKETME